MGQYAGFGTAAETNARFRALLDAGCHGLLRRARPADPDGHRLRRSPRGRGGRQGRRRDRQPGRHRDPDGGDPARADQPGAHDGELDRLHLGGDVRRARRAAGPRPERVRDVHPERRAQGVHRPGDADLPAEPSLRLSVDVLEYVARARAQLGAARRSPGTTSAKPAPTPSRRSRSRSRTRSPTSTPPWPAASRSTRSRRRCSRSCRRTSRSSQEVAKFRAARRVWAKLIRERYAARDPRSEQLRIFVFTAGSSLTAQQPLNNVVRTTVEATAAALAGVQTMHVCAYDEAVGVPTEAAATLALRTQQIVAFETGLTETVDPLGGSHAVEALTTELESRDRRAAGRDRARAEARWPASSRAGSRTSSPGPPTVRRRRSSRGRGP